jgi:hypothetical protein
LVLESEKVLEETVVCEDCVSGFRDEDWIKVEDTSESTEIND